jgi:hypothetical protein
VHPVFGGYGVDGVLGRFWVIPDAFTAEYCEAFSAQMVADVESDSYTRISSYIKLARDKPLRQSAQSAA